MIHVAVLLHRPVSFTSQVSFLITYYLGAQLEGGRGGGLPCPFLKYKEKCPDFWEKCPNWVHLWVKFLILNAVLSVSRKKISEIFPCGAFLSCVAIKCLSFKVPLF